MTGEQNLPAIRSGSPLAEGITVNIRMVGREYQLQIWAQGLPVEDTLHPTSTAAIERLGRIVFTRMGGKDAVIGAIVRDFLGGQSR